MAKVFITVRGENEEIASAPNQVVETDASTLDLALDIKTLVDKGVIGGSMSTGEVLNKLGIESDSHDTGTDERSAEERRAAEGG